MRKIKVFSIVILAAVCASLFVGCGSSVPESSDHEYPWSVILHWEYQLDSATASGNLENLSAALDAKFSNRDIEFGMGADSTRFRLAVEFCGKLNIGGETFSSGYAELNDFFNLDMSDSVLDSLVGQKWEKTMFTRKRTLTFANPWGHVLVDKSKSGAALNEIRQTIVDAGINIKAGEPKYEYEFVSSFKRHIENKTSTGTEGYYQYFFAYGGEDSIETVVIVDRFENGAMWYGVAVVAMAVFMVIVYILAKNKEKRTKSLQDAKQQQAQDNTFTS